MVDLNNLSVPQLGLSGLDTIIIAALFFVFFVASVTTVAFVYSRYRWPFKVVIFENVSGQGYVPSRNDRARLVSFGDGGEEVFFLRKNKKYRVAYGKRVGKNYIAWAIGQDGYWYNITFENLDRRLQQIGVEPVDKDMRFASSSLRKGIDMRLQQKDFFSKYGVAITIGVLILAIVVGGASIWINLDKQQQAISASAASTEAAAEVLEEVNNILGRLDTITSGSGVAGG